MLLLTINRKPYMASPMTSSHLTLSVLERSLSQGHWFWAEGDLHEIDIFARSDITALIWMSQKVVCWRAGFSAVPGLVLVTIYFIKNSQNTQIILFFAYYERGSVLCMRFVETGFHTATWIHAYMTNGLQDYIDNLQTQLGNNFFEEQLRTTPAHTLLYPNIKYSTAVTSWFSGPL